MAKIDVYMGDYLQIQEVTPEESTLLASNECVVGTPLSVSLTDEPGVFRVHAPSGASLGTFRTRNQLALRNALENGWVCKFYLTLVYYVDAEKLFKGEFLYQCYNIDPRKAGDKKAFDVFSETTRELVEQGERPCVQLTGEQYDKIVETAGTYRVPGERPLPTFERGEIVFKKKKSLSDRMVAQLAQNSPSTRIIANLIILLILLGVLYLIAHVFLKLI